MTSGATVRNVRTTGAFGLAAILSLAAGCTTNGKDLPPTVYHAQIRTVNSEKGEQVQEIHIVARSYYFEPSEIHVKADVPVILAIDCDTDFIEHSFAWETAPADGLPASRTLRPGAKIGIAFTPKKPGRYPFVCDIPSHRKRGMQGALIVE